MILHDILKSARASSWRKDSTSGSTISTQSPQNVIAKRQQFVVLANLEIDVGDLVHQLGLLAGSVERAQVDGVLQIDFVVNEQAHVDHHGKEHEQNLKDEREKNGDLPEFAAQSSAPTRAFPDAVDDLLPRHDIFGARGAQWRSRAT
jgi:hypothetical protein